MLVRSLAILLLLAPSILFSHPHVRTDQQVHLSISRKQAVIVFYIAPSAKDGAHMFEHIDTDTDGSLSHREQVLFANGLVRNTAFLVNGRNATLTITETAFPEKARIGSGRVAIRVKAKTAIELKSKQKHRVFFAVSDARFATKWHVQPFFSKDVNAARPLVKRLAKSNAVEITI